MDHGKNVAPDSLDGLRGFTKWTTEMDLIMLNAMIEEVRRGCRINGSWTSQGYTNIVMTLHEVGLSAIKKNHVNIVKKASRTGGGKYMTCLMD